MARIPLLVIGGIIVLIILSVVVLLNNRKNNNPTPSAVQQKPITTPLPDTAVITGKEHLEGANFPGCVFTLRFDTDGKPDNSLKLEANAEITKIREKLISGTSGQTVVNEIIGTISADDRRKKIVQMYGTTYIDTTPATGPTTPVNKFRKFGVDTVLNECSDNLSTVFQRMNQTFFQLNPELQKNLDSVNSGETSAPFLLYDESDSGKYEFAWMIITRNK